MTKDEALERKAENARELGLDYEPEHGWTPERIAGMARLKEAQDKKLSQRTWVGLTIEDEYVRNYLWERALVAVDENPNLRDEKNVWVGLTDEEIWSTVSRIGTSNSDVNPYAILKDARAIEAKLRSKNT